MKEKVEQIYALRETMEDIKQMMMSMMKGKEPACLAERLGRWRLSQ